MWPAMSHDSQEPKAFVEPSLRLSAEGRILDKAMLEIDSSDNGHTMTQSWIGYFKAFLFEKLKKMYNPTGMKRELLERVAEK